MLGEDNVRRDVLKESTDLLCQYFEQLLSLKPKSHHSYCCMRA